MCDVSIFFCFYCFVKMTQIKILKHDIAFIRCIVISCLRHLFQKYTHPVYFPFNLLQKGLILLKIDFINIYVENNWDNNESYLCLNLYTYIHTFIHYIIRCPSFNFLSCCQWCVLRAKIYLLLFFETLRIEPFLSNLWTLNAPHKNTLNMENVYR